MPKGKPQYFHYSMRFLQKQRIALCFIATKQQTKHISICSLCIESPNLVEFTQTIFVSVIVSSAEINLEMARLIQRAHALLVILGITLSNFLLCPGFAFPNGNNYYSTLQEYQTCDHIIPKFIEQVMNQDSPKCDETGAFPKPGNCTVFFKCIRSKAFIQPFVEYCEIGYNFVGGVCLPNTNSSDCPQYTCRIPDISGVNEIASDTKPNYNDDVLDSTAKDVIHPVELVPLETPPTASPFSEASSDAAVSTNKTPQKLKDNQGTVHSEQVMYMTQKGKNSGSSLFSIPIQFTIISSALSLFLK